MPPVHASSLPLPGWRSSASHKTYPPCKGLSKTISAKWSPCSILKKSPPIRGTPKKRVRFSLPGASRGDAGDDDSISALGGFKGFTSADILGLDKLRKKMQGLQETLTLRQRIAVEETIHRKDGAVPIKVGGQRAYLCQKKLERRLSKTAQMVNAGNANGLFKKQMKKLECGICSRVAYLPETQQQTEVGTSSKYFCNDCFEKSTKCTALPSAVPQWNVQKTGFPPKNPPIVLTDQELESQITISSVCSFPSPVVPDDPSDKLEKLLNELFDDKGMSMFSPVQMDKLVEPEGSTYPELYDHQIKNEVMSTKKFGWKTVTVWTAEGPYDVLVPCSREELNASMTPLSKDKLVGGTEDDPIYVDDD